MTPIEISNSVRTLKAQGHGQREIGRLLKLSRNTVRRILREPASPDAHAGALDEATRKRLAQAFARAKGNAVRMGQILAEDGAPVPPYSTLTRWVREAELRAAPKRSGEYHFAPGREMQHDTSPHRLEIDGRAVTAQCAALVLAYSRRLYVQYYPRYTRFEAKHFLLQAAQFMGGTCPCCVIDNTSVVLAGGSGEQAVIAPEMKAFARCLGWEFKAHRIGDPNRKGRIERPFFWLETNFLPGRIFSSFDDLNAQARHWCIEVANVKPRLALGMSADAAYVMEAPFLVPLPGLLPAVYDVLDRVVDLYGFVNVECNRYSAPERLIGKTVTVYKHMACIDIHYRGKPVASHPRLVGVRDVRHTLPGHHTQPQHPGRQSALQTQFPSGQHPALDAYVAALGVHHHGRGARALNRLLQLKRSYPPQPFLAAVAQALKYRLFDLTRLETLILRHVAGDFFAIDDDHQDDDGPEFA
jgi:transposase